MAESNSRPRPRPRPKPKVQAAPSVEEITPGPSTSTVRSSSPLKPVQDVVDTDAMFMRNTRRTVRDWGDLEKRTKETKVVHVSSESDEEVATPRRGRKAKRKATSPWQANPKKALDRLLSVGLSDESDNDIEIVGTSTTPRNTQAPKRKRQRTRSRSITPPPALPIHQLQHARAVVQQTLGSAPRPASPTLRVDDDLDDAMLLNPELARLAKAVASRAQSEVPFASSPAPENAETVQLAVRWQPHPLNKAGEEDVWVFKMNRDDNFRDLFEATAEEASILSDNLIMSYNGKRIYSTVTPMALRIWGEAELVACDKVTYEYIRANPAAASHTLSAFDTGTPAPEDPSDTDAPSPLQPEPAADSDEDGDTLKLVLRSTISTNDITLTVRPTTKCGAIVKAFLKKAGVAEQYPGVFASDSGGSAASKQKGKKAAGSEKDPRLCVDGERMGNDVEIGEADLEDGDLVEVVGL
ncbi:putative ubiquitin-2 like Rad60 SUMO-like [Lyophyllum shimeji]|uniref:Ubiquitin-2 like Rad60 SUMO-like n=1 Tax=Lyophyllum shimeji TaxID=47721 RepID=A0A9P3PKX8_LYOSH|nr:putative ubiquitin-2 like Rad60 SUMO-like [Lyophyllum shimeji]